MVNLTNGLLTGGLGVDMPACAMIMTAWHFNLGPCFFEAKVSSVSSGGSKPLAPGEIHNFYKPIDPTIFDKDFDPSILTNPLIQGEPQYVKTLVTVRIRVGERMVEREFAIPKRRAKIIVKVLNIMNSTKAKLTATVNRLTMTVHKISVKINRLRKRDNDK